MAKKPSQLATLLAVLTIDSLYVPCTMKGGRVTHRVSPASTPNWPRSPALCGVKPSSDWRPQPTERADRKPCATCLSRLTDITRGEGDHG